VSDARSSGQTRAQEREGQWLSKLAPALRVTIPTVVATGEPAEGCPWTWSVHRWIEGENPVEGHLAKPGLLARDLAEFVKAIRTAGIEGGPSAYRGVPLMTVAAQTRAAIEEMRHTDEPFDADAAAAAWQKALAAPPVDRKTLLTALRPHAQQPARRPRQAHRGTRLATPSASAGSCASGRSLAMPSGSLCRPAAGGPTRAFPLPTS
jgi:hypothetical protein